MSTATQAAAASGSADRVRELLEPHRGKWVAVERPWQRIIAVDEDLDRCLAEAERVLDGERSEHVPLVYRVPPVEGSA